jgi:hypothetical protein
VEVNQHNLFNLPALYTAPINEVFLNTPSPCETKMNSVKHRIVSYLAEIVQSSQKLITDHQYFKIVASTVGPLCRNAYWEFKFGSLAYFYDLIHSHSEILYFTTLSQLMGLYRFMTVFNSFKDKAQWPVPSPLKCPLLSPFIYFPASILLPLQFNRTEKQILHLKSYIKIKYRVTA